MDNKHLTEAEGFAFYNEEDARECETEASKIRFLEEKIDYSKPETILHLYEKAVEEKVFKSPQGLVFMKKLESYLRENENIPDSAIPAIPLYLTYGEAMNRPDAPKPVEIPVKSKAYDTTMRCSIIINIVLALAVIAMFVITLKSPSANILNYKKVLTNNYSQWEQELTERENAVREAELELARKNDK